MDKYKTTKVSITQYFFEIWALLSFNALEILGHKTSRC